MATRVEALIAVPSERNVRAESDGATLAARIHALHATCFGWAMSCCGNRREEAEDLLQDVYVSALENGLRFNGDSTLRTWLFGVIRHKARSRLRRERLRELLGIRNAARIDAPTAMSSPDADLAASERRETTRRALDQLPQRQRQVVLLVFYHDMTLEESAGVLGISVGSTRVHYDRGKRRLAALLEGERP
jgi:RNA polymerase sigma-70 factor (ECF subfamily)